MASVLMTGVSGCRGVVGESLTPEVAARFAGAFGSLVRERFPASATVALARDGRAGCAMMHHAAVAGLIGAGVSVVDLGVVMTPTAAVMVDKLGLPAGMVLTASHNPQQWNGLKCLIATARDEFSSAACAPDAALANEIVARFRDGRLAHARWAGIGSVSRNESAVTIHVERVCAALENAGIAGVDDLGAERSVVLDSVNASGVEGGMMLLERLGCEEIMHLGGQSTGVFPHPPEPVRENLETVLEAAREMDAECAFVQDPDADRLAIIDEKASYIGEEYTLVLGALALLEAEQRAGRTTKGRALVTNLSTSRMIEDVAARFGARVVRTAVGEANVVEAMKREKALVGGEGNGGVIWPRVTYVRDSLSAMALTLSLLREHAKPLSAIVESIPSYAIEKRKVDLLKKEDAAPGLEKLAKHYAKFRVDRQDGVRIDFDDKRAWLHVRASNTEPIMRLIAEAPTPGVADEILDEAGRIVTR